MYIHNGHYNKSSQTWESVYKPIVDHPPETFFYVVLKYK